MALSRIQTAEIADNAITTAKVDDATVIGTDIVDGTITNAMVASGAAIAHTKCAVGPVASLNVGTGANQILQLNGSGVLPVLDGTALTGIVSDFTPLENQLARLGLHLGAVEQLAKFNMIDQVIDDYEDATGITANNATSDVYGNITNSTSGLWLGATSDFTYTGANVVQNSGDKATWMNVTFSGDFDVTFTKTGSSNDFMCGLNLVSDESGNILANNIIRWETHSVSWFSKDNHSLKHGSTVVINPGAPMIEQDTVHAWKRRSGVISFYKAGSLVHTYTQTSTAAVRFGWNGGGGATSNGMASVSYTLNPTTITTPATANTGSSSSAELQGSAGAKYYEGQADTVVAVPAHTITRQSTTQHSTAQKKFGSSSILFNGTSDTLTVSDSNDWALTDFTIEMWIRTGTINRDLIEQATANAVGSTSFSMWVSSSHIYATFSDGSTYTPLTCSSTVTDNNWHHIAAVRSGSSIAVYIDGTSEQTATMSAQLNNVATGVKIGRCDNTGAAGWFPGYMDEIRISNVARWTSNFTPPTASYTRDSNTLLLLQSNTTNGSTDFVDSSGVAASTASDSMTLISTTTTAQTAPTKASIVLQTEDEVGTATINTDVKAGVSRDALNYVDTTLAKIGTWGSGNVYAANDVTMPGTITKAVTARSSKFHVDEVSTTVAAVEGAWVTGDQSSLITVTANGIPLGGGTFSNLVDGLGGVTGDGQTTANGFYWSAQTPASGSYIRFTFSSAKAITEARWFTQNTTYQANWKWQGSNDASTWTDLNSSTAHTGVSVSYPTDSAYAINWSWANTTAYTYYQYLWVSGAYPQLWQQEVEFKYGAVAESTTYSNQQPTLELTEGYTYKFDTSDSTLSGHTFSFATAADAAGSTEYTTGVTTSGTPGSANAYTQIVVPASAPTLYYYCSNHASMGGTANTPAEAATTSMRYRVDTKNQSYTAATPSTTFSGLSPTVSYSGNFGWQWNNSAGAFTQLTDNNHESGRGTATTALNGYLKWDMGQNYIFNSGTLRIGTYRGAGDHMQYTITYSTDDSTYSAWDMSGISQDSILYSNNISNVSGGTAAGQINFSGHSASGGSISLVTGVSTVTARYIKVTLTVANLSGSGYDANGKITNFDPGTVVIGTGNVSESGKITRIHGTSLAWK